VTLAVTGSARRTGSRRQPVVALAVAVLVAAVLGAVYLLGYRLNVQTGSVPVPSAAASPDDVVRSYVEAYNHRDFDTTKAIYPSGQSAFSRYRAMGTMRDLRIIQSRATPEADLSGTSKAGYSYDRVEVTVDYSGLTGSGLAYDDGPNGWTYWLERSTASEPWTITDHGNG
jgi:hypothetical protein